MAFAVIESLPNYVKIVYNDADVNYTDRYVKREHIVDIVRVVIDGVEIVRVYLDNLERVDAHYSTIDTIQAQVDVSPVPIRGVESNNDVLLSKLLEIWVE